MKSKEVYAQKWEFSGYIIREGAIGFIVEWWSACTGSHTGRKVLVKYTSLEHIHKGVDMAMPYSNHGTNGQILQQVAADMPDKVLRKGHKVA